MQIETLKDILHWTAEFHEQLSTTLTRSAANNEGERERMLLDFLADHEERLAIVIEKYEKNGDQHALSTWCYEYLDKQNINLKHHTDIPFSQLSVTEIMEVLVDEHQQVIELYRYLASRADISSAKELLDSLVSLEEHEMMLMAHAANRLNDL